MSSFARRLRRFTALAALLGLLAGCAHTRYEFIPPPDDKGKACVTGCANARDICTSRESQQALWDQMRCERQNDLMVRRCMATAGNRDEAARCGVYRQFCWGQAGNTYGCELDYRQCFQKCGGQIRAYEE